MENASRQSSYRPAGGDGTGVSAPAPKFPLAPSAAAVLLTFALLALIQWRVPRPMLLAERFLSGAGWAQAALLALYAGVLVRLMLPETAAPLWRRRLWILFSAVFFGQLLLGLAGFERFLMTGKLHLPIPALILGGPLYRGEGYFMPFLFGATILLVGPAWCSHLCYLGAWDLAAARRRRAPLPAIARGGGGRRRLVRWGMLGVVAGGALTLRALGVPPARAMVIGALLGLAGVAIMLTWSRRTGEMAHCSWYCPIGILSTRLGCLSPFRLRVLGSCTRCGLCSLACRYDTLTVEDVRRGRPGASCTLCGDCLGACRHESLVYRFPGLSASGARRLFLVLVVSLHAVFLGVARI